MKTMYSGTKRMASGLRRRFKRMVSAALSVVMLCSLLLASFPGQAGVGAAAGDEAPDSGIALAGLAIGAGELTPAFAPDITEYEANVPEYYNSLTVTPIAEDDGAAIEVSINGDAPFTAVSGEPSAPVALEIGDNVIAVRIVSSDGQSGRTYRIKASKSAVVLQEGQGGYAGSADTQLSKGTGSGGNLYYRYNLGAQHRIEVGYYNQTTNDEKYLLFRFDNLPLPDEAAVMEASLNLYHIQTRSDNRPRDVFAHKLNEPWVEGRGGSASSNDGSPALDGEVTWENYITQSPELPYDPEPAFSVNIDEVPSWYSFDIRGIAQDWADDPESNHGVLLKPQSYPDNSDPAMTGTKRFVSREDANAALRPYLRLVYTEPLRGIAIDEEPLDLLVGQEPVGIDNYFVRPLHAAHTGVQWTSSDENVARVDANGTVTPVGEGVARITATVEDGLGASFSDQVEVRVTAPQTEGLLSALDIVGVELSPSFVPLAFDYTATVPLNAREVTLVPAAFEPDSVIEVQAAGRPAQTVASGEYSLPVTLDTEADSTVITVTVGSADGEHGNNVYTIQVNYRLTGGPVDNIIREFLNPLGKVMVVAHRGNWLNGMPENGLDSVRESIAEGVDMVELDIRTTSDGVPVIMHDGTVNRTTNGTGNVSSYTLEGLKQLCLRNSNGTVSNPCEQVPTLEEVMELAYGNIMVNLDIKSANWDVMWDILERTDTTDHALYKTSASKQSTAAWMEQFTRSAVQPLFMQLTSSTATALDFLNPATTPFTTHAFEVSFSSDDAAVMNPDFIRQIHEQGARIWVNTIFSVGGMVGRHGDYAVLSDPNAGFPWLTARGVDMIQTDTTALLLKFLRGELTAESPPMTHTKVLQEGLSGYSGTSDAFIIENPGQTANNTGAHTELNVGYNSGNSNDRKHGLLRFDLSDIPEEATIVKAELELFLIREGSGSRAKRLFVHEITEPWTEGTGRTASGETGTGGVTWATRPAFEPNPAGSAVVGTETTAWYAFDVKSLVGKWVGQDEGNYGLLLRDADDAPGQPIKQFASSENGWQSWRPKLSITYTVPVAGVEIVPDDLELEIGERLQLSAAIKPVYAVNHDVSWSSDNELVARVDADGMLTALTQGTAVVRAVTYDGGHEATATVAVRSAGNSSFLGGLALGEGRLTETFDRSRTEYAAEVPEIYDAVAITPHAEDEGASIEISVNGDEAFAAASGEPTDPLPLDIGDNRIVVKVTAADGRDSRSYTITIPKAAVALQEGQAGYAGAADTQLSKGTGGTGNQYYRYNLGAQHRIEVGYYNQTTSDEKYVMFRFDHLPLPEGAVITEASLNLYHIDIRSDNRPHDVFVHKLNNPWTEGRGGGAGTSDGSPALDGEVTWENYITQSPELPYDPEPVYTLNIAAAQRWYSFDITDIAQDWADDPDSNHGVLLKPREYPDNSDASMKGTKRFLTKENPDADLRPYLRLVYEVPAQGLTVDRDSLDLLLGGAGARLTATVRPLNASDRTVTWTSDNEEVAAVDSAGLVTPIGAGEAVITAAGPDGLLRHVEVTVRSAGTEGRLESAAFSAGELRPDFQPDQTEYELALPLGSETVTVAPRAMDAHADVTVAVDGGEAAPALPGGAGVELNISEDSLILIRSVSEDGQAVSEYRIRVNLEDLNPLVGIEAEPSELTLTVGTTRPVQIYGLYKDGTRVPLAGVEFVPEDADIAEVSPGGTVFAKTEGRTVVNIAYGGRTTQLEIQVRAADPGGPEPTPTPTPTTQPTPTPTSQPTPTPTTQPTPTPTTQPTPTPTTQPTPTAQPTSQPTPSSEPEPSAAPGPSTTPAPSPSDDPGVSPGPDSEFEDTASHWAASDIAAASLAGFVNGFPDGNFKPEATVTRAQFAVMLVRALKPQASADSSFAARDAIPDWARAELSIAVQAGILQGYEDGTIRPDRHITRVEMLTMLLRALGLQGDDLQPTGFTDEEDIPVWARPFVVEAVKLKLVSGYPDGGFRPDAAASRAQAVSVIMRALETLN